MGKIQLYNFESKPRLVLNRISKGDTKPNFKLISSEQYGTIASC